MLCVIGVKGGTQQISERLADRIGREKIHLKEPVESISQQDKDNLVTVCTGTGKIFRYQDTTCSNRFVENNHENFF